MKEILLDSSFSEEDRNLIHSACLQVQSAIDLHGSNAKSVIPQIINGLVSKSTHKSNEFLVVVGLWVAALSLLKKHLHSEDYKYPTLQAFFNVYITILDFENRSEQEALWHTANWMAMLLSLLPSTQNNKPLAMLVVPKVAEGWQADYVTGPDKSNAAAKRAQIYSVESSVDIENNADMDDTSSTTYPEDMGVLGGIRDDNNNKSK
ncbi:hypothetical protein EON65_04070 [archaeon]|nr:MAG: hypothetical protein EON65_04070 [archaeon]